MKIQKLVQLDISDHMKGHKSADEFLWDQTETAMPLIKGALAIAERANEKGKCKDCEDIFELLSAFDEAIETAQKKMYSTVQARRKSDEQVYEEVCGHPYPSLVKETSA